MLIVVKNKSANSRKSDSRNSVAAKENRRRVDVPPRAVHRAALRLDLTTEL
jgi:hypothetical protein